MIYFPSIFEIDEKCKLRDPGDTLAIGDFGFLRSPVADECIGLELKCRYTENISEDLDTKNFWFKAKKDETLFRFYSLPVSAETLATSLNGKFTISDEDFVPVIVESFLEDSKIPTTVELTLLYY